MAGLGSPCGACKFLRRKCVRGCVFAPYFSHEQAAAHFAAVHKVFGASNASKLLMHLPVADRSEAALTISYEAQARLQDPIYGCVAHIFALQQQVVTLEAQLASLKAQTAQGVVSGYSSSIPRLEEDRYSNKLPPYRPGESLPLMPQRLGADTPPNPEPMPCQDHELVDSNSFQSSQLELVDDNSSCAMATLDLEAYTWRSAHHHDMEDLRSVAFGRLNCA
ncbi:hypothetical protein OPV22_021287 [Ensete ventricosum]|uniref:LOB domain-containing protein n=1 Tax=Ensete ventricosum TaxID=4639 RepID=A0AAV8PAY3_ENSVE|nr:hypothetical protein OPV22_021287 [Ensete ventricosum]